MHQKHILNVSLLTPALSVHIQTKQVFKLIANKSAQMSEEPEMI